MNELLIPAFVFAGICVVIFIAIAIVQLCCKFRDQYIGVITPSADLNLDVGFIHYHSMNIESTLDSKDTYHLRSLDSETAAKV